MNALVPRKTVEMVVAARDQALALYETAFQRIAEADDALKQARLMWKEAAPSGVGRYYDASNETKAFHDVVSMPDRDQYLTTARRLVDITVWQYVVEISGIEDLMDHTEKQKLRDQMKYRAPKFKAAQEFLDKLQCCVNYTKEYTEDIREFDPYRGLREFGRHVEDLSDDPETVDALGHDGIAKAKEIAQDLVGAAVKIGTKGHFLEDLTTSVENLNDVAANPNGLPPVSVDNIMATMNGLLGQSNEIFLRGIASSFSALDRRFRSHDGFKIGNRIIIDRLCDDWGYVNHGRQEDIFIDVERILRILDKELEGDEAKEEARPVYGSLLQRLRVARQGCNGARQSEHEGELFKVRIFKNGNAHIWFTRKDLLTKVNRCLAEYYGEVVGDGQTKEDDPLKDIKTTPAKRYGFYPTPSPATSIILENARLFKTEAPLLVLEPQAGSGNLARPIVDQGHIVDCVEIQPQYAGDLEAMGKFRRVMCADFLTLKTEPIYDRVVMNPPFDRERDIDHVAHALKFLKPNGFLIAIMSAGTEYRDTKKSNAFRKLVSDKGGRFKDLPDRSFSEVGTNINTCYVRICNDGTKIERWQ